MTGEKVGVGIVGFGRMGITHLSILNSHPQVEIVGVVEEAKLLRTFGGSALGVRMYESLDALLDNPELDAVVIATPPKSHDMIVRRCLDARKNVFCEKPLTESGVADAELAQLAYDNGLVNQVGYVYRAVSTIRRAREIVELGVLGSIYGFSSTIRASTVRSGQTNESWRSAAGLGGGCLLELGSHAIDLSVYLFGSGHTLSDVHGRSVVSGHVDDFVSLRLAYDLGFSGYVTADWMDVSARKASLSLEVWGHMGRMIVNPHEMKIFVEKDEGHGFPRGWSSDTVAAHGEPGRFYLRGSEFTRQLDAFVTACSGGATCPHACDFRDAAVTGNVISEARSVLSGH